MSHQSVLIEENILEYLKQHQNKQLLRFITCGSVDDGKSTLIGRLLHDSKMIFEDQLASITADSKKVGTQGDNVDLALLVDGLQAEREQGITIDVAYRYFSTEKRKFIIADTPGHEQYTRNMATGASNCDLAIILIDASHGVQTQTKRHSYICSLLGIKHIIVAVNKMDLVEYSQDAYKKIQNDYIQLAGNLDIPDVRFVPISARDGDNVVHKSEKMPWFRGSPLMYYLENMELSQHQQGDFRFPVQLVNRPHADFRGFQGTIASGQVHVGDVIRVLPANKLTTIKAIVTYDGNLESATAPMAVTLTTTEEVDISRGDMLVHKDTLPYITQNIRAKVVWMTDEPLVANQSYTIKFTTKVTTAKIENFNYKIDINTLCEAKCGKLELNEIGSVDIALTDKICFDNYTKNRTTGSFIIIDKLSNNTVGAGMIEQALITKDDSAHQAQQYSAFELELNALIRKHFPHWDAKNLFNDK